MTAFVEETGLLTSSAAADLLQLALTGDPEVVLPGFTATLDDLHYRPGSEVTGTFTIAYRGPDDRVVTEHLLATTAEVSGQVATLSRDGVTLRVWRHPADPRLPGLAPACDPATAYQWLTTADPGLAGASAVTIDLLAYRPLRRAVVRAEVDADRFFLKVMRPGYDDRLAARQEVLAAHDLTAPVLSRPAPGVLVSPAVPGQSLAHDIVRWQRDEVPMPSPQSVIELLDRLPDEVLDLPPRPSWSAKIDFHAATARRQLPEHAARIDDVAALVRTVLSQERHGPLVPTHGDLYEANIFVDGTTLRFIDVDSVGPGLREDDLACALAHLAVLPGLAGGFYTRVPEMLDVWQRTFETHVDPVDLHARTAGVLISLVAGATPAEAVGRLELAEQYAASAR